MALAIPPKPDAQRRNRRVGPLKLPAAGRTGAPPAWPLDSKPGVPVGRLWAQLWATPHAVAWERLGWTRTVARYALILVEAETTLKPALLAQALAAEDRLGLSPKAMRLLMWEIDTDEVAEQRSTIAVSRRRIKLA